MTNETATPHWATSSELDGLRDFVHGPVIGPGENGYDEARSIWNGAIDRRPAGIVRCAGVADVAAAVRYARERDLLVAVRSGGHGVGGHALCDGGLVVDLSPMRGIRVDPAARTARAEAGVLWGEFDRETQLFGLATVGGIVTHTGIAGLTLGGGIGWLMRKYGATVDNLLSVDLVLRTASSSPPARTRTLICSGACAAPGGNFGIVTSFEYRLHPVGPIVLAGPIFHPLDDAPEVLRFYREFAATAPDELTTIFELEPRAATADPARGRPRQADSHGGRLLRRAARGRGRGRPPAQGVRRPDRRPARAQAVPGAAVDVRPLVPHGWHRYWKSVELPPLTDDAIDTLIDHTSRITSPRSYTIVLHLGGALARVAEDATAFSQRDAAHNVVINAVRTEDDPDARGHIAWARDFFDAMQPHARDRVYVNFLGDEDPTASARPTAPRSTTGWSSSNASTTPRTSSASTRTSRRGSSQKTLDRTSARSPGTDRARNCNDRSAGGGREAEREAAVLVHPPAPEDKAGVRELALEALAPELRADLGAEALALCELDVDSQQRHRNDLHARRVEADVDPLGPRVPEGAVLEACTREVGPSSRSRWATPFRGSARSGRRCRCTRTRVAPAPSRGRAPATVRPPASARRPVHPGSDAVRQARSFRVSSRGRRTGGVHRNRVRRDGVRSRRRSRARRCRDTPRRSPSRSRRALPR